MRRREAKEPSQTSFGRKRHPKQRKAGQPASSGSPGQVHATAPQQANRCWNQPVPSQVIRRPTSWRDVSAHGVEATFSFRGRAGPETLGGRCHEPIHQAGLKTVPILPVSEPVFSTRRWQGLLDPIVCWQHPTGLSGFRGACLGPVCNRTIHISCVREGSGRESLWTVS